ncbi:MAG: type II secretion system protein [Planctomycetes bacterium]|nr:type II secretion system protein [Planctomycetota bacterium]
MSTSGCRERRGETGFSLIELLVVIAIIGVLAMFLAVGVAKVRDRARIAKAIGLIQRLEVGCQQYNQVYLSYPTYSGTPTNVNGNSQTLFVLLCSPLNVYTRFVAGQQPMVSMNPPVLELKSDEIQGGLPTVGQGQMMPPRSILDPWGNAVNYVRMNAGVNCPCRTSLPVKPAGGHDHRSVSAGGSVNSDCTWGRTNDPSFLDGRRTCDLESMGVPDAGLNASWNANDICNWKPGRQ